MSSADYVNQQLKGIKKSFDNGSQIMIEKYTTLSVFDIEVTDQFSELFTSTEGLTGTRKLGELEQSDTLSLQDGVPVTLTSARFGGNINVSSTTMVQFKDSTTMVDKYVTRQRDKLLKSIKNTFARDIHLPLNEAFTSTVSLAPDGAVLCGTHTWASGNTFSNLATAALSQAAVDASNVYAGSFVDGAGTENPLEFDTIVVKKGSTTEIQALKLFAEHISPVAVNDVNIYEGTKTIISTPYLNTAAANFWFMFDTNIEVSPIHAGVTQMPTLTEPVKQNNQSIQTDVEGFWSRGISNMPYMIYGSNGTT